MLLERQRFSGATVGGRIYACGGINDFGTSALCEVECLDPTTGRWEDLQPMAQNRASTVAASLGGQLFVCGGVRNGLGGNQAGDEYLTQYKLGGAGEMRSVECLDPATQAWQMMPPMFTHRAEAAAAVISGCLFVCGGVSGMEILSSVECFSPELGSWTAAQWMLVGRCCAIGAAAEGKVFVFGGQSGPSRESRRRSSTEASAEQFDPAEGAWALVFPSAVEVGSGAMAAMSLE